MPIIDFICPDNVRIPIKDCLKEGGCRMGNRCATRSYLRLVSNDRKWTGRPSTTQLINGTMNAFLKIIRDYAVSPDDRAFMINGTKGHNVLEGSEDELSFLEERFTGVDEEITGITDVIEIEDSKAILADYKVSGSYKVAKALGFYVDEEATGEKFLSGKKKGEPKMRKILKRAEEKEDRWEWELQLNFYRLKVEKALSRKIDEMRIQVIVRDGGTYIARSRGVFRKIYYFKIKRLDDKFVQDYFDTKKKALIDAIKIYETSAALWPFPCTEKENWDNLKCASYCEVAEFCPLGKAIKEDRKTEEEMAIKGVTEIRRLPRLGKIRLGIKKKTPQGKEYPAEVDYFIMDPQTPSELENKKLIEEFKKRYGDEPKQIPIMFPLPNTEVVFPQFYKRYGTSTSLQCKGDGEFAVCASEEFTKDLEVVGKDEMGLPKVICRGEDCPYFKSKKCGRRATLQVLLPEMPGAGVWQINTGSFNSIVNINSCLDYVRAMAGRFHMLPLILERREQEIVHDGQKRSHYILHINMNFALADLQKFAQISPERAAIALPEIDDDKEDILFSENKVVDHKPEPDPMADFKESFQKSVLALGESECVNCLGRHGFLKPEEVILKENGEKIISELREIYKKRKPENGK